MKIGVTERGDAANNLVWLEAVKRKAVDGCIAITKAPQALLPLFLPSNVMVHCTITGQGGTVLEPNVALPEVVLAAYHELVKRYGGERIVLRIDPILLMDAAALDRACEVCEAARGRVRISFLDYYPHVRERFTERGITYVQDFHAPLILREKLWAQMGKPEVCAEPGMICSGCVSQRDLRAMGIENTLTVGGRQRQNCACAAEKVELLADKKPCKHACLYCYWQN